MKKFKRFIALGGAIAVAAGSFALSACGGESETQKFINESQEATASATYNSAAVTGTIDMSGTSPLNEAGATRLSIDLDGLLDIKTFDMDLNAGIEGEDGPEYGYIFMRDMQVFPSADTYAQVPADFSQVTLVPSFNELANGSIGTVGSAGAMPVAFSTDSVFALATLAESYSAVTLSDDSLTLNIVSLMSAMYDDVLTMINSLTDETTISDIYANNLFVNTFNAANIVVSAEQLYTLVNLVIFSLSQDGATDAIQPPAFTLPEPEEGQSLYDYIGSLLGNEDLAALAGIDTPVGELKIVDLINLLAGSSGVPVTAEQFKEALLAELNAVISFENGFTLTVAEGVYASITNMTVTYGFDGEGVLTSSAAKFAFAFVDGEDEYSASFDLTANYSAESVTLRDINSNPLSYNGQLTTVREYLNSLNSDVSVTG